MTLSEFRFPPDCRTLACTTESNIVLSPGSDERLEIRIKPSTKELLASSSIYERPGQSPRTPQIASSLFPMKSKNVELKKQVLPQNPHLSSLFVHFGSVDLNQIFPHSVGVFPTSQLINGCIPCLDFGHVAFTTQGVHIWHAMELRGSFAA